MVIVSDVLGIIAVKIHTAINYNVLCDLHLFDTHRHPKAPQAKRHTYYSNNSRILNFISRITFFT